ncbi:MAG TPA: isoleucine--tRNA ligase [Sphingomonas sp.]|nr:isoleucine--tRNA ligase [Sphingomonas sp.]
MTDYRSTVFLPKTDFPMKAGLPQKEPGILAKWQADDLYKQLRKSRAGREKFILHDGPPYANGDMHIGHALNHILKDMVVRTQTLLGKDAPYVPGWDCHGLPIEWKVEEQYRKKKLDKDQVPAPEFRAECRAYAQHWVDTQREQLKRLGINGDWDKPYLTMDFDAEATIVAELMKFAESGQLYRGAKPVMWSPVEKTALAEAEVEYEDIVSTQIDVAFEIVESPIPELVGVHAVIWTTTPWTIPVNQALAYGPNVEYMLCRSGNDEARRYLVAVDLLDATGKRLGDELLSLRVIKGSDLAHSIARHPMHHLGGFFARPRPFLAGDFVTTEQGTGLVHMAPDHGEDDFELCKANEIEPVFAVEGDGKYRADWLWLGGQGSVINPKFNAPDGPICEDLRAAGALLAASADYQHSYPHSWRSKAKLIFRATPQWFIPVDQPDGDEDDDRTLRQKAMAAIAATRFVPEKGRNRIGAMVEGRPDWVISRQRAWGVPITLFVNKLTGQYLVDEHVNARIVAAVREKGVDAWSAEATPALLGGGHDPDAFEMVTDILDVWFDSGCTHAFVLESGKWPELRWPADLYLEGSDQHRGWFQSSLLESCGTRGRAPYDAVLTHGFTMASDGKKMSKSLGNTVDPLKVMEQYGADIIRLWALSVDFTEDHRIGDEILKGVADQYRKLRNTFRYLLGALDGFSEVERVDAVAMPELERYILHRVHTLDGVLKRAIADFDFNTYTRALADFANDDLSAFFFDIRKDNLYCDAADSPARMAYRTTLDALFHALVRWAAPILVFTAEEVWTTRYPGATSVHLLDWPVIGNWHDAALGERWDRLRAVRGVVLGEIEPLRREKVIGSGLEADVTVIAYDLADKVLLAGANLSELAIVAKAEICAGDPALASDDASSTADIRVEARKTEYEKCERCWRHLPEVEPEGLCDRCASVVA